LLLVQLLLLSDTTFSQGSLTPPGPPAPTMKKLDQIEPRTDLQATPAPTGVDTSNANFHFIINRPGSYYLSANLEVTKTNGIQINVEGVTLDLNGFEISRASGSGGSGIEIPISSHRSSVFNGSIKGFALGVNSFGGGARGCNFHHLSVSNCTSIGILAGEGAVVESCRAHGNSGSYAILTSQGSVVSNCTVSSNTTTWGLQASSGSSLTNCSAHSNTTDYGINAGAGSSLTNCSAYNNTGTGAISAGIGTGVGCTISHCSANSNTSTASTPTFTTGMGFDLGSGNIIRGCTASSNKGDGINVGSDTVVRDNIADSNGNTGNGAGIHATSSDNRIEDNNVTDNDRGLEVGAGGNLIVKNSASGNTVNYEIAADNRYGAILDLTATGSAAASGNSAAGTLTTTTNPWANFAY